MWLQLIILYSVLIVFNNVIGITSDGEQVTSRNIYDTSTYQSKKAVTQTEDTWQPILQTHNWLQAPTILAPTFLLSTEPIWRQTSNLGNNNLPDMEKQNQNNYQQLYSNAYPYQNKKNASKLTTIATPLTKTAALQSFKHINFKKTAVLPLYYVNHNNEINNISEHEKANLKYPFKSHERQQHQFYLLNPQTEMPNNMKAQVNMLQNPTPIQQHSYKKNRKQSKTIQQNFFHLANAEEYRELNSPSPLSYWPYLQTQTQTQSHTQTLIPSINWNRRTTFKPIEYGKSNEKLFENLTKKFKENSHNSKYYQNPLLPTEVENRKSDEESKNNIKSLKSQVASREDFNAELFLRKTLQNAYELYVFLKDRLIDLNHKVNEDESTYNYNEFDYDNGAQDEEKDEKDEYSNEDIASDDSDPPMQNVSSRQVVSNVFETVTAAIATALEKLSPLKMENMLLSLASTDEIKGYERKIDENQKKHSISKLTAAATTSTTSLPLTINETNETHESTVTKEELQKPFTYNTQTGGQLQNVICAKVKNLSSALTLTKSHRSSSLISSLSSKGVSVISSSRKVKKIQKKLKKKIVKRLLLPLLLAYKMKFFTLIPVLIGGMVLLVTSTGLAGFFFALFATVMTLSLANSRAGRRTYELNHESNNQNFTY